MPALVVVWRERVHGLARSIRGDKRGIHVKLSRRCKYLLVVVLLAAVTPASSMTIRHDRDDQQYRDFADELAVGGALTGAYVGSGTLISPTWVLTAKHVLSGVTTFRTSAGNYKVVEVVKHPTLDFGLARLETPVVDIDPVKLYSLDYGIDHGRDAVMMGAGQTGTGLTGQISLTSGGRRAGQTYVFANASSIGWSDTEVLTRFRAPNNGAADLEGGFTNGDSGGGLMFNVHGEYAIAGVLTTAWTVSGKTYGEYVTGGGYTRSALLNDWIQTYATDAVILGHAPLHEKANLVFYEGFDYQSGAGLKDLNGGKGWAALGARAGWKYSSTAAVQEGTLTYTDTRGNMLQTSGNSTAVPASSLSGDRRIVRWACDSSAPAVGSEGGEIWISYLVDLTDSEAAPLFGFAPGDPASIGNAMQIVYRSASQRWELEAKKEGATTREYQYTATDGLAFVLLRMDYSDDETNAYLWINPDLDEEPELETAGATLEGLIGDYTIRGFQLSNTSSNLVDFGFDELRLGTSFDSVTPYTVPEPGTWAICCLCAAILARRRRKASV